MIRFGVDCIETLLPLLKGSRVALLTSATGRNSRNRSTVDVLHPLCRLTALLAPEHGVRGDRPAGALVEDETDPATGLPVYSLYSGAGHGLPQRALDTFDTLVYDIQDVGLRFYTYISTLRLALRDCAATGKRVVVLDRPNPLGGEIVEGGLLQSDYRSFVGCCEIPIRYALTVGEFALLVNDREQLGCDLHVVRAEGWRREMFPDYGQIWQPTSVALSTFEATLLYAGICLFEGTNLSEGRGTAAPMRMIGAPGMDGERLLRAFERLNLPGVAATPAYFCPTFSKHEGALCGGLMLHVTDARALRPIELGVRLLRLFLDLYPDKAAILPPRAPDSRTFLSLLTGCGDLTPDFDPDAVLHRWSQESEAFRRAKSAYHLYP